MSDETTEYLRRNLVVSKAVGVDAGLQAAIKRLPKRTPQWLRNILANEQAKMAAIKSEAASHRDEIIHPTPTQLPPNRLDHERRDDRHR